MVRVYVIKNSKLDSNRRDTGRVGRFSLFDGSRGEGS